MQFSFTSDQLEFAAGLREMLEREFTAARLREVFPVADRVLAIIRCGVFRFVRARSLHAKTSACCWKSWATSSAANN